MAHVTDNATGREFDATGPELDYYRGEATVDPKRYVIVDDPAESAQQFPVFVQPGEVGPHAADEPAPFDPAEYTVEAVNEYLDTADADERVRVLQLEADGEDRKGIVHGPHRPLPGDGSNDTDPAA